MNSSAGGNDTSDILNVTHDYDQQQRIFSRHAVCEECARVVKGDKVTRYAVGVLYLNRKLTGKTKEVM